MSRHKEFDVDEVVERAMELFWSRGYEATSLGALTEHLGIGKGSFYNTFGGKRKLFLASLDRYREAAEAGTVSTLEEAGSPKEAIRAVFGGAVDGLAGQAEPRRGCLLANTAVELAPHDPEVGKRISRYVTRTEEAFEWAIVRGQTSGELTARHDPEALARFLVANLLGLRVLAKTGVSRAVLEDSARVALGALE